MSSWFYILVSFKLLGNAHKEVLKRTASKHRLAGWAARYGNSIYLVVDVSQCNSGVGGVVQELSLYAERIPGSDSVDSIQCYPLKGGFSGSAYSKRFFVLSSNEESGVFFKDRKGVEYLSDQIFRTARNVSRSMIHQVHREIKYWESNRSSLAIREEGREAGKGLESAERADMFSSAISYLESIPYESYPEYMSAMIQVPGGDKLAYSFSGKLWDRTKFRTSYYKFSKNHLEFQLERKSTGEHFASSLGLPLPECLINGVELEQIEPAPLSVVKPDSGSGGAGVYLYFNATKIWNIKEKKYLSSFSDVKNDAASLKGSKKWRLEKMITDVKGRPANDFKFYCFYGRCPLVLEVARFPDTRYCWHILDSDFYGTIGKYSEQLFEGTAIEGKHISIAEWVSKKIPAPFMRVDFYLGSGDQMCFGEFTPKPGSFHDFSRHADRWLGRHFVSAEARLYNDFAHGVRYPEFNEALSK